MWRGPGPTIRLETVLQIEEGSLALEIGLDIGTVDIETLMLPAAFEAKTIFPGVHELGLVVERKIIVILQVTATDARGHTLEWQVKKGIGIKHGQGGVDMGTGLIEVLAF